MTETPTDEEIYNLDNEYRTNPTRVEKQLEKLSVEEHTKLLVKIIELNQKVEANKIKENIKEPNTQ